jgi:WD40 repeat protein
MTVAALLGLLIVPAVILLRRDLAVPAAAPEVAVKPSEPKAARDWKVVLAAWNDPRSDREQLRSELLHCLHTEAGTAQALQAAALLRQLPSPLDRLDRMTLPPGKQFVKEQVGIVGKVRTHAGPARHCVAFSEDGLWLADGGEDGKIRLWRTQDLGTGLVINAHQSSVRELLFAPDGQSLVSVAGGESTPVVWDLTQAVPRERARLAGHSAAVRALAFAPDGKTLASASMDSTVRLWDMSRRACPERGQLRHKERVLALAYAPDGTTLASSGADLAIRLWEPGRSTADPRTVLPGLPGDNSRLAYLADGKGLIAIGAGGDWALRVAELTAGDRAPLLWGIKGRNIPTIALSPHGQVLAVCFGNGELSLYNPKTGLRRFEWRWAHPIHCLDFAPDNRHLAIATHDGLIAILRFADVPPSIK